MSKIISHNSENISKVAQVLRAGDPVALPTETVYGLAANAFDDSAVLKIFSFKQRPKFDPLIVHVSDQNHKLMDLHDLGLIDRTAMGEGQQELAERLMQRFWPGPLTILFPRGAKVSDLVTAQLPMVGLRMPANDIFQKVLAEVEFPLAAPSANKFTKTSPTTAEDVLAQEFTELQYIVQGGPTAVGVESTVVRINADKEIEILRPGGVTKEILQEMAPVQDFYKVGEHLPHAPGMLKVHYRPEKPAYLFSVISELNGFAVDRFTNPLFIFPTNSEVLKHPLLRTDNYRVLSDDGSDLAAAKNLFAFLNEFSRSSFDTLLVRKPIEQFGLWAAVNDKLRKACSEITDI